LLVELSVNYGQENIRERDVLARWIMEYINWFIKSALFFVNRNNIINRQKSDTCHGDIRPCNILLSNDKYKLADTSFFNKQSSYLDVLGHNKED
jgi:aminoglycoside phosphotransferase family enzyme